MTEKMYVVLEESSRVAVSKKIIEINVGDVLVVPSETVHITKPNMTQSLTTITSASSPYNDANYSVACQQNRVMQSMMNKLSNNT